MITAVVYKKIIAGKLYMDQNFHEAIDLYSISRNACISRFHFHRLFTRVYNKTPHQYLTKKRIRIACELLADSKFSVSKVCNTVGFESMGSFSVLFKKETGLGPAAYRNMILLKKRQSETNPALFIPGCFLESF